MGKMTGRTVAVTGARSAEEFANIVQKMGGTPLIRPAQGTVYLDDSRLAEQLRGFIVRPADWMILTTGVGLESLLAKADELGCRSDLVAAMATVRLAVRGYKTVQALQKLSLTPHVRADDGTTAGLLRALETQPLEGSRVVLQLYGDPAPTMTAALRGRGALCEEWMPYRHVPPAPEAVDTLLREVTGRQVDAVLFTSTVQARYVLQRADALGVKPALLEAFETGVVAAAIGKVTAEALREEGVSRMFVPAEERLGYALIELGRMFEDRT